MTVAALNSQHDLPGAGASDQDAYPGGELSRTASRRVEAMQAAYTALVATCPPSLASRSGARPELTLVNPLNG